MTLSTTQPNWPLNGQQPALIVSRLSHLGLMSVTGEQGRSFIHGQVTTDISSLEATQWRWGAHCDPKGKMLATFRTFAKNDTLFLMMPTSTLALDLPQLQKYAVFSKAKLTDVTDNWLIYGVAGEQAATWLTEQFGPLNDELTLAGNAMIIHDSGRYIVAIEQAHIADFTQLADVTTFDATAWQALEILAGYPNISAEHQGKFVPQMCNVQAVNGISFNKGCYMGQETIARMKYRGGNKRALYIVSGTVSAELTRDSQLEIALEEGEGYRRGGTIIECVQRDNDVLLTAVLANDTPLNAALRIADDAVSSLSIVALPYSLEDN
ncbi:tRNA-modifying protein YgfZ [Shewanella youngdeokensis]|uniref:tRNA-modifying protein YgfZ n=1 Tax=Shewanella youngdeokensis TaxID=2999068 RepID=A0ABZ0K1G9_9GAMM|nr:tRNA-modifying protein YgfZ [Shewanella sp. DAU334]